MNKFWEFIDKIYQKNYGEEASNVSLTKINPTVIGITFTFIDLSFSWCLKQVKKTNQRPKTSFQGTKGRCSVSLA